MIEMKDHMVRFATTTSAVMVVGLFGWLSGISWRFVPFLKNLGRRRLVDGSGGLLNQIDLRSGHAGGGHEGAVLGAD